MLGLLIIRVTPDLQDAVHSCCKVEQIWRSLKVCSLRCLTNPHQRGHQRGHHMGHQWSGNTPKPCWVVSRLHQYHQLPKSNNSLPQGCNCMPSHFFCSVQQNAAGHFSPFTGPQGDIVNRPSKGLWCHVALSQRHPMGVNHEVERGSR